jgi:hypothetical protein
MNRGKNARSPSLIQGSARWHSAINAPGIAPKANASSALALSTIQPPI